MPSARSEILKRIFKKGVRSSSKAELDDLFKKETKPLIRYEIEPDRLAKEGFTKKAQKDTEGYYNLRGLYWAKDPSYFEGKYDPSDWWDLDEPNVLGIMKPGARVYEPPYKGWLDDILRNKSEEDHLGILRSLEDYLEKYKLDFADVGDPKEILQVRPKSVLAKIRKSDDKWIYKILSLLGAMEASKDEQQ